jgi:diguanylate cyclase (GGDEF)-like protein
MQLAGFTMGHVIHAAGETVVAAALTTEGEAVVLKILNSEQPAPEQTGRWQHEFSVLQTLDSEWVIGAKALLQLGRRSVLVLENFASTNLAQVIARNLVDFSDRLSIALQLTQALSAVHASRLIHGDIAPKNVLVDLAKLRIKLCDFGLATRLEHAERREQVNFPRGTLDYMSPEQTGRTNLEVDYRSDFYSLGVTLYELFSTRRPFQFADSMGMLHAQLTMLPEPLHSLDSSIPEALSMLVQKLLAKYPDDRYQSSYGLYQDLSRIADAWAQGRGVETFALGQDDVPERFCLPQKLYGREQDVKTILSAFERVVDGPAELVLISGAAGIGKTTLVSELHRPIVARRGYFLRGKCDQFGRNQPYAALVRAFEPFLQQLASEGETRRHYWRDQLSAALGEQAAAIAGIIPNLSLLLGALPPLPMVPAAENEQRFHIAFLQFVKALAANNHPLMLFLDDLQWADASTLRLLEQLISDEDTRCVLIAGAYRQQALDALGPLAQMLERLRKKPTRSVEILLENLSDADVSALLTDTLKQDHAAVASLCQLIMQKTLGNPFFLGQFLRSLHEQGALHYQRAQGSWQWDVKQILSLGMTDNVVSMMLDRLRTLAPTTQDLLAVCAQLGDSFCLRELMAVEVQDAFSCHARLWPALQSGLLLPLNEDYKFQGSPELLATSRYRFLHDRVQLAAHDLTPESQRVALQLRCGRRLLEASSDAQLEDRLFTILACLNAASSLISDASERATLLKLNVRAGLRAKSAAAFETAVQLLRHAKALLPAQPWISVPEQSLALYQALAEAEYLAGNFDAANALYPEVMTQATSAIAKVSLLLVQADQLHIQGRFPDALPVLHQALQLLGRPFPETDAQAAAMFPAEFAETEALLGPYQLEQLLQAPEMQGGAELLEMRVYFALSYATYQSGNFAAFAVDACRMVQTTLKHGQGDLSCIAYVIYMTAMAAMRKPYPQCHAMGRLALAMAEKRDSQYFRMPVYQYFSPFYQHWCEALPATLPYMERGLELALTGINPLSGGFCVVLAAINRAIFGEPLESLALDCQRGLKFLRKSHQPKSEAMLYCGVIQPMLALQGKTLDALSFDSEDYSVSAFFAGDYQTPSIPLAFYITAMLRHSYLLDSYQHWQESAPQLGMVSACLPDSPSWVEAQFYVALGLLNSNFAHTQALPDRLLEAQKYLELFQLWARDCAANFRHKHLLIAAELARCKGESQVAMDFYAQAIDAASDAGFLACEALANERYGEFWAQQQQRQLARNFIKEAYHLYRRWGASAKCAQLEQRWPEIALRNYRQRSSISAGNALSNGTFRSSAENTGYLDLQSLLKANQLLAKEIQLDALLRQMLSVLLENAGAEKGAIILADDDELIVEVVGGLSSARRVESVRVGQPLSQALQHHGPDYGPLLPSELIEYTKLTHSTLVVNSPHQDERFARSAYFVSHSPKSVLCLPVVTQGRMVALVYLENNQLENAFSTKQQQTLELLGAQAAISLLNARLVEHLEAKVEQRTQELRQMTMRDGLTGIANRRAFDERLEIEWRRSERDRTPLSLLMIDIDHFKQYNDGLGHLEGDRCIRLVAQTLAMVAVQANALVARYGGEEFSVLLPESGAEQAQLMAQRCLQAISAQALVHPNSSAGPYVSISVGVCSAVFGDAESSSTINDAVALISKADAALFRAKHAGRNRLCVHA